MLGRNVGTLDGARVGFSVGSRLGAKVGTRVGESEFVGAPVGVYEDGSKVGANVAVGSLSL
jgi:hypothetical protein